MKKLNVIKFQDISIRGKYYVVLSLTVALFLASTLIAFRYLKDVKDSMRALEQLNSDSVKISEITTEFLVKDIYIGDYISFASDETAQKVEEQGKQMADALDGLKSTMKIAGADVKIQDIVEKEAEINGILKNTLRQAVDKNDKDEITLARVKIAGMRFDVLNTLAELRQIIYQGQQGAFQYTNRSIGSTVLLLSVSIPASAVLGFFIMTLISWGIQRNINKLIKYSNQIADNNLTSENIRYKGENEIGKLAASFNKMSDNLRNVVKSIFDTSMEVESKGNRLMHTARDVMDAGKQITGTMEQLAYGTQEQAGASTEIANSISRFDKSIDVANAESRELADYFSSLVKASRRGSDSLNILMLQLDQITLVTQDSVEKVKGLDKRTKEISGLVNVIGNIAKDTSLLSLNASIEASKAGESGRGFAVVAQEIRKLAGNSQDSLVNIRKIIEALKNESVSVVNSLKEGCRQVEDCINQIKGTGESFGTINTEVSIVAPKLNVVTEALQEIAESSKNIRLSIEQISASSQEIAAGTQETSAIVQNQNDSMVTIIENIKELSEHVEKLVGRVSIFKLPAVEKKHYDFRKEGNPE